MNEKLIQLIETELAKAREKHPDWPNDQIHATGIVCEESGELMRAAMRFEDDTPYPDGSQASLEDICKECVHTIVTAIRCIEGK